MFFGSIIYGGSGDHNTPFYNIIRGGKNPEAGAKGSGLFRILEIRVVISPWKSLTAEHFLSASNWKLNSPRSDSDRGGFELPIQPPLLAQDGSKTESGREHDMWRRGMRISILERAQMTCEMASSYFSSSAWHLALRNRMHCTMLLIKKACDKVASYVSSSAQDMAIRSRMHCTMLLIKMTCEKEASYFSSSARHVALRK